MWLLRQTIAFAGSNCYMNAVCAAAAEACSCDALVTGDPGGYAMAPLPVIDPAAALSWLTQE